MHDIPYYFVLCMQSVLLNRFRQAGSETRLRELVRIEVCLCEEAKAGGRYDMTECGEVLKLHTVAFRTIPKAGITL